MNGTAVGEVAPRAGRDVGGPLPASAAAAVRLAWRSKTLVVGAAILGFWVLDAFIWRALAPYPPQALHPDAAFLPPSGQHWFGTDNLGRDVLSRTLAGAPSVLLVGGTGALLGLLGGTIVGLVSGYFSGAVDTAIMRGTDAILSIPLVIFAAMALGMLGASDLTIILVIGFIFTPIVARTVRGPVLVERSRDYVALARLRGESAAYIMAVEILPNITGPLAVEATARLGYGIFLSATLSFLGLGLQPPSPVWGLTVSEGRVYLEVAPWIVLFPAFALASLVVSINLITDGLQRVVEEMR